MCTEMNIGSLVGFVSPDLTGLCATDLDQCWTQVTA